MATKFEELKAKLGPRADGYHRYEKQNLVTLSNGDDIYKCVNCGATATRRGTSWPPTIDKKFYKKFRECPVFEQAAEALAAEGS